MSLHPHVKRAARQGLKDFGLSVAASRLTTGNHPVYGRLEQALARYLGCECALLSSCGYTANLYVAQALAGEFSHVLLEARAHPALLDAATHFRCPIRRFQHRDALDLARQCKGLGSQARVIVLTDGMFSQDGAVAPLAEYVKALPVRTRYLVDDSHGVGVLGGQGRGAVEQVSGRKEQFILCFSLSKALGTFGGAILCSEDLRNRMIRRSQAFLGSTPLPLPLACAALQSVELLQKDSTFLARLNANAAYVKLALRERGFEMPDHPGPIVAIHPHSAGESQRLWRQLKQAGILPPRIKYAGEPRSWFRFVISSEHTRAQLDLLIRVVARWKQSGRIRKNHLDSMVA